MRPIDWTMVALSFIVTMGFWYMGYRAGRRQGMIEGSARRRYPRDVP